MQKSFNGTISPLKCLKEYSARNENTESALKNTQPAIENTQLECKNPLMELYPS